ncbi:hypothetical protein CHS0354_017347 [Potamilus streckersoni]|uniref:E3 ubiquitin-protein ligase ZSWIM2 n=1 Tax=Potamilus streckersoni TaxID=2493646 RepID=A0AAE0W686_9BIVA|nr:hypothetical protein CHS0354_017347 [Potamilus streckersoni]
MARSVQWRRTCNDLVFWRQCEALNATIYILRETGPTGFLLKEEGETKPVKAFLGDPHHCTCSSFKKDRDLCKHICWLLLKKFRVSQTDPLSWQMGLVERDINNILRGINYHQQQQQKKKPVRYWLKDEHSGREMIKQRDIGKEDLCPICQDELLSMHLPVTFCKFGCGNSIHIKCMKIYAEHQKTQGDTGIKCPLCREDFGPIELLKKESMNALGHTPGGRMDRHIGIECLCCHVNPIEGKCYRCGVCANFYLCQSCFNTPVHTHHGFEFRHKRNQKWRAAQRMYGAVLPQALVNDLLNREISETDYDLLMQLDSNTENQRSDIPEEVIQGFPLEKVRESGPLLAPGMQCRICLRGYEVGEFVRKLPRCKHKFHRDCIDSWLLHSHPTCPIDGQIVWDPSSEPTQYNVPAGQQQRRQPDSLQQATGNVGHLALEVPGVGLAVRTQEGSSEDRLPQLGRRRGGRISSQTREQNNQEPFTLMRLRSSFILNGMAVGSGQDEENIEAVPGGRLLNHASNRREELNHLLTTNASESPQNGVPNDASHHQDIENTTQDQTDNHSLESHLQNDVMVHNNNASDAIYSAQQISLRLSPRRNNVSAMFANEGHQNNQQYEILSNLERSINYAIERELPVSGLTDLDFSVDGPVSVRSHDQVSTINGDVLSQSLNQNTALNATQNAVSLVSMSQQEQQDGLVTYAMLNIPPQSRLFAQPPTAVQSGHSGETNAVGTLHRGHRVSLRNMHEQNTGSGQERERNARNKNITRQTHGLGSAPATTGEGVREDRGRRLDRSWSQSQSIQKRSHSREHSQERDGSIPKEGQNLLDRIQAFSDLYLGNNPHENRPPRGVITTATGLPPRPPNRLYANHAAARQRRREKLRQKNEFSLEGNSVKPLTFGDLLH